MQLKTILQELNTFAPLSYQESYDNAGLICGDVNQEIHSAMLCLDVTPAVVEEAVQCGCNLIISHHPLIFKGIKKLIGSTDVERALILAIRNHVAIYAAHTNLDNVSDGVNAKLAQKLGLAQVKILDPLSGDLKKLVCYAPESAAESVRSAIFSAGAGMIGNYDQCSFNLQGNGTFRGNANSSPFIGKPGELHTESEIRIETIFPKHIQQEVLNAMRAAHPYEEVAYDIYPLENLNPMKGAGAIGDIPEMKEVDFLLKVKEVLNAVCIRHTALLNKPVKKVALCGGSGSFLLKKAIHEKADVFISADFKYHDFFEAEGKILIIDAGHFETEQFTIELFYELLMKKFPTFAICLSKTASNPVFYL
jgi:dinuclear metal center YbgI/SA1388 family protein